MATVYWEALLNEGRNLSSDEDRHELFRSYKEVIRDHLPLLPSLRLAYSIVSFRGTAEETRHPIQDDAYKAWSDPLLSFLASDSKRQSSRRIATKILCNMIADHDKNSCALVSDVQLEPDLKLHTSADNKRNWVDLILCARHDRVALAALLATLHNCIQQQPDLRNNIESSSSLLVSTLLRQLVGSGDQQKRDQASDWVILIVTQLSVAKVYRSISESTIVPEHVVFLLSTRIAVEEQTLSRLAESDWTFLVDLFLDIEKKPRPTEDSDSQEESVCHLILEILCEDTLQNPIPSSKDTWGPQLMPILLERLASIIDKWNSSQTIVRHRTLSPDTQRWLVNAVRCIGLLCHKSPVNQEMLREKIRTNQERSGLHVLLSSTSLAPACFTVREWAVVAIRYALEDCPANQLEVERLQAQGAVQSADLQDMGVRVELQQGKVSVVPSTSGDDSNKDGDDKSASE